MNEQGLHPSPQAPHGTRAALYLRLSREDGDKAESDSITNQRALLRDYLRDRPELQVVGEFVDDGCTGTDFDRPAFLRMMEAVHSRRVNCILVKDLSRLGRNYIETGRYLERIFPALGVRFIAVTDRYDSAQDDDAARLMNVFRNLMNDAYCRDLSAKIRSQQEVKRRNGQFIGSFAAYGYRKDPQDHNRLLIDDSPAEIVRQIFGLKLEGYNAQHIARQLNAQGAPTPLAYRRHSGQRFRSGFPSDGAERWSVTAVRRILENELYTGTMVQGKTEKISYKLRQVRPVEPAAWVRVAGTHDPIIPREVFDAVQALGRRDTRTAPGRETLYPLCGLVICGTCGQSMVRRSGGTRHYFHCSTYKRAGACSSHLIAEEALESATLAAVQARARTVLEARAAVETLRRRGGPLPCVTELRQTEAEEKQYRDLQARLYQDLRDGTVRGEDYAAMRRSFAERAEAAHARAEQLMQTRERALNGAEPTWMAVYAEAQNAGRLDRRLLSLLVEAVVVHSKDNVQVRFRCGDAYIALGAACRAALGKEGV